MECKGECKEFGKCVGEVKKVYVVGWGYFNYCETAIETDRLRGFTIIEDENREDE